MGETTESNGTISTARLWSREFVGELQILLGVLLFGASFVGQKYAMSNATPIGPVTYNAWRFSASTILLLTFRPWLQTISESEYTDIADELPKSNDIGDNSNSGDVTNPEEVSSDSINEISQLWYWGGICGIANFVGSVLQQISLMTISVASAGFITGMYVVVVPLVERFILHRSKHIFLRSWVAAVCSMVGLYLISGCYSSSDCISGADGLGKILVFISMFSWVVSILACDTASKCVDCVSLTCVDFIICAVLNIILAIYMEPEEWVYPFVSVQQNWMPILLVGFTEAGAFTASTIGQMYTPATRAALLYSMEAVSSAYGGYLFLGEVPSMEELGGCGMMFIATIISSVGWCSTSTEDDETKSITGSDLKINDDFRPLIRRISNPKMKILSNKSHSGDYVRSYQSIPSP